MKHRLFKNIITTISLATLPILCVSGYAAGTAPSPGTSLHPVDTSLLSTLLASSPYSTWNAAHSGYGVGLTSKENANMMNPCNPDFDYTQFAGMQKIDATSSATVSAGPVTVLACLTPNPEQSTKKGSYGSFDNLAITGPLSTKQPLGSFDSQPAVIAGYIEPSNDGSQYVPRVIAHTFYVTGGTLDLKDFHEMGGENTNTADSNLKVYIYQKGDDRLPNPVSPDVVYPTNLIYDRNNEQRSSSTDDQPWKDAYPFLIQLHSKFEPWGTLYHAFSSDDRAPSAIQAQVTAANNALTSQKYTPYYAYTNGSTTAISEVGYYRVTDKIKDGLIGSSTVNWLPPTPTEGNPTPTDTYELTYWVKPVTQTNLPQLESDLSQNNLVKIDDHNAPEGGDITQGTTTFSTADNGWVKATTAFTVNSVKPANPVLLVAPDTISYDITDFSFEKESPATNTEINPDVFSPNVQSVKGSGPGAILAQYDFNRYKLIPADWRIRNKGVGSSNNEAHTGSLGSNLEYVDATTNQNQIEKVLRFRNFGGDDDSNVFQQLGDNKVPKTDALGYSTGERQGAVIATTHAYGNADYIICARFPRRTIGEYLDKMRVPRGTYYPYNTGGVTALWPYHYTTLTNGMIGFNDSSQSVLRNSEIDVEIPAFDGLNGPFPPSSLDSSFNIQALLGDNVETVANCVDSKGCKLDSKPGDGYHQKLEVSIPVSSEQKTIKITLDPQSKVCFSNGLRRWVIDKSSSNKDIYVSNKFCSLAANHYSYRVARLNSWGGDYSGYGNNLSARPSSPLGSSGLDDGKFHQITIESVADTPTTPGHVAWYYADQCTVQKNIRSGDSMVKKTDLGSLVGLQDKATPGVLLPHSMGQFNSDKTQWLGNTIAEGFDDIPSQAMQFTLGIWNPTIGDPTDYDSAQTRNSMGWGGTSDYIDEDHAGTDPRLNTPSGAATFRCGKANSKGTQTIDTEADNFDSGCKDLNYAPHDGTYATANRSSFITSWADKMADLQSSYNLPALNPARNNDVYINPVDMTNDKNQKINYALTKASFGGNMPANLNETVGKLKEFDNERDLDVSSIYIATPASGQEPAGVLDTYNTDDYKDNATCKVDPSNDKPDCTSPAMIQQERETGCTCINALSAYQFPTLSGNKFVTYPIDLDPTN